jgi:uncharacterized protein
MLSYNVASLLRAAPGTSERFPVLVSDVPIAEELELAGPVSGEVRLSRTSRSILVRGHLDAALRERCSRCLRPVVTPVSVDLEEEALPSIDIDTGLPIDTGAEPEALRLDEHHELDLSASVGEALSLAEPIAPLCRPECRGLCLQCGADLNADPGHAHGEEDIDPRLAGLKAIRDQLE